MTCRHRAHHLEQMPLGVSADAAIRLASQLLATDPAFALLQRGLHLTLTLRRAFDRRASRAWRALDLASQRDIHRLFDHIQAVELSMARLEKRAEALAAREERARAVQK